LLRNTQKPLRPFSLAGWQKDTLSMLVLAVLLLIVFWPVLFEHRSLLPTDEFDTMVLPWSSDYGPPQAHNNTQTDAMMQSYPWKVYEQQALRSGQLAYWNPLVFSGYPQYATSRQTFDVFNLLLIPFDLPFAFNLIIILELFVAGIGMYVLLRCHERTRGVSLLFASGWMLNGMFLTHGTNLWVTATFCWIPFAIAMLLRYRRTSNTSYLLFTSLFIALAFFGSTLQVAVFIVFLLLLLNFFFSRQYHASTRPFFISSITIFAIAFALTAIMWLPSLELFRDVTQHGWLYSPTHSRSYTIAQRGLSLLLLTTFFVPELLGQVNALSITSLANVHPLDFSGYVGFIETLMALWAVLHWRKADLILRGYGWIFLLGFLLPILTPLYAIVYHRFFIVGTLGLIVFGAAQFDSFLTQEDQWRRVRTILKPLLFVAGGVFVALVVAHTIIILSPKLRSSVISTLFTRSIGTPFADGNLPWVQSRIVGTLAHYSPASATMLVPFAGLFAICALLWYRKEWLERGWTNASYVFLLFVFTVIPVLFWWRTWLPMSDTQRFPLLPTQQSITFLQEHAAGSRIYVDRELIRDKQYIFLDNLPSMYGLSEISGYESEVVRGFYGALEGVAPASPHPKALGLMGVKYFVYLNSVIPSGDLSLVDTGQLCIYENPHVRPRATLVYNSQVLLTDSTVRHRLFDESIAHNEVLFTKGKTTPPLLSDTGAWEAARIVHSSNNEVTIEANPSRPAYLVLSDTYYPGWKCLVDGKESTIYRANFAMRAVYLSSGKHQLVFRFEPTSFAIGKWISIITLCCMAVSFGAIKVSRANKS
jgi:hypothetical protein